MTRRANPYLLLALVFVLAGPKSRTSHPITADQDTSLAAALLAAEDSRPKTTQGMAALFRGLAASDPEIQRIAVRGLGRLENPELLPRLREILESENPAVRSETVNALGQAVFNAEPEPVLLVLQELLSREDDPGVRAVVWQTLGRLPYTSASAIRETEALFLAEASDIENLSLRTLLGYARGLESLSRQRQRGPPSEATLDRLKYLAGFRRASASPAATTEDAARVRRLAVSALGRIAPPDALDWHQIFADPDEQVRQLVMVAVRSINEEANTSRLVVPALSDPAAKVRYEALGTYGARLQETFGCEPIRGATLDDDPAVVLRAIDLLGNGCARGESPAPLLEATATALRTGDQAGMGAWHKPSHALVALARVAPERARTVLPSFIDHSLWQVRMYAARAASLLGDAPALERLAYDEHHNVREVAINGLGELDLSGNVLDAASLSALEQKDYQLLRAASAAFDSDSDPATVVPALLETLRRVTAERRETSRDARTALLEKLIEFGEHLSTDAINPYLSDFDPVIAARVAEFLTERTGSAHRAEARLLPRSPLPSQSQLAAWDETSVTLHTQNGTIELQLFASEAPTNVARFVRLAEDGYFDGLTFHRVAPNFVIQGGSPGANEYYGDGLYTRDELTTRGHWRGTVGISTRGRDTGDGQIFINLVDNNRLDYNYTIIGEVVLGMEVVDGVLEGAVIERVGVGR